MIELTYMPIDVPKLELDRNELLTFHDENTKHDIGPITSRIGNPWNLLSLCLHNKWAFDNNITNQIRKHIETRLPLDYLVQVYFLEQVKDVPLHRDVSKEAKPELGPSTYRMSILNDEPGTNFYFIRDDDPEMTHRYLKMPSDTNTFCINNNVSKHGSTLVKNPNSRKIILGIWSRVNKEGHLSLLRRSYDKYKDFLASTSV